MLNKFAVKAKKGNKGFTLIELIVVIAIIAILALILIPRFGGFREEAQNTADKATARTINSAVSALMVSGDIELDGGGDPAFIITDDTIISGTVSGVEIKVPTGAPEGATIAVEIQSVNK
jgi:prepilin-type N-terminal cleavage/methylation domain-containing protein